MLSPLLLLAAATAANPAPNAALEGLWQGNIGTLPVRACFTHRDWGWFGAYYYLSRLQLIPLEADAQAGNIFREGGGSGDSRPAWTIERADAGQVTARWTGGGRTLPVRLNRVAGGPGEEGPCASAAFHQPRLAGIGTVRTRATVDGVTFTRISLDTRGRFEAGFTTFALDGTSEGVRRINAAAARGLGGDPPLWFDCVRGGLEQNSTEGSVDESLEPVLFSRRWLGVAHHWEGYCGGAHPDSSSSYQLFELATGREIDLHDWLNARAVHRERPDGSSEEIKTLLPELRAVILAGWHADPADCDEAVRGAEFWTIGLNRDGLVFSPDLPHVVAACGDEFTVPLARLRPFLTDEGAANLRGLAAEPAPAARPAR